MRSKIGIIGYGIVGQALAHGFSNYPITYHDKFKPSVSLSEVVKKSEFIFICLPTPMKADESGIDLAIINQVVRELAKLVEKTNKIIVIKSTVTPGTTAALAKKYPSCHFAFNPEFLTEANYLQDFIKADRTIIGTSNKLVSRRLMALYRSRFPKMKIFQTDLTTAEMVKYMANTYLATKVIFANQIAELCRKLGLDYSEVKRMVVADHRIYDSHLDVSQERGFGGKCFPKDLVALLGLAKKLKVSLPVLEEVWRTNKRVRKVRDWEEIPFAVSPKAK